MRGALTGSGDCLRFRAESWRWKTPSCLLPPVVVRSLLTCCCWLHFVAVEKRREILAPLCCGDRKEMKDLLRKFVNFTAYLETVLVPKVGPATPRASPHPPSAHAVSCDSELVLMQLYAMGCGAVLVEKRLPVWVAAAWAWYRFDVFPLWPPPCP